MVESITGYTVTRMNSPTSLVPIRVTKTDGDLTIAANTGVFVDVQGGGTLAAKSCDLVLPASRGATEGDWVSLEMAGLNSVVTAAQVYMDFATINAAGAIINRCMGADAWGYMPWVLLANVGNRFSGKITYQLQAADFLANGDVRFRAIAFNGHATANKVILAQSLFKFREELLGPFG